jgi:hypothetical protein
MNYDCGECNSRYAANDAVLLASLPAHIRAAYPVEPRYANGAYHFTIQATDELEPLLKTYANGDFYSKKLYRTIGLEFERKVQTYLSKAPSTSARDFEVTLEEWIGKYPPSGDSIRKYYETAEYSPFTPYGISNFHRYERELQSVGRDGVDRTVVIDWTFAVLKNYVLDGAKACFTMKIGTGETAALAIVSSTSVSQIAHLLQEIILKRPNFRPDYIYTDTWPSSERFWKNTFGWLLLGRLGLFHIMHRILDTLNSTSAEYWKALVALKAVFYRYNDDDHAKVLAALKDGSLSRDGKALTDKEIDAIKHSKRWNQRYSKYLRKILLPTEVIKSNLIAWTARFTNQKDDDGRHVCSRTTEGTALEQMNKACHIQDPPDLEMYTEILPGPRTKHGISQWESKRLESKLEKFHEALAHFANTGMKPSLGDDLTLRGSTEDNTKIRFKLLVREERLKGKSSKAAPSYLENIPPFWNHAMLHHLNEVAVSKGLTPVFSNVRKLDPDNGEVFLSIYFKEQKERNTKFGADKHTNQCQCPICSKVPFPLVLGEDPQLLLQPTPPTLQPAPQPTPQLTPRPMPQLTPRPMPQLTPLPAAALLTTQIAPQPILPGPAVLQNPILHAANLAFFHYHPLFAGRPPDNCCMVVAPYYCPSFAAYLQKKQQGIRVFGRPPHDTQCPCRLLKQSGG